MKRAAVDATAAGPANNDWNTRAPTIAALRSKVCNLVESARNKIGELHFRNRTHSHQCRADGGSDDSRFRYGCVDDAPFAKAFEHAGSHLERTAVNADILTEDEHTFVLFHFFPNSLANCFDVRGERH